jgi:hypothetical protein
MTHLVTKRWTRYGKDRVYVTSAEGQRVGWLDLKDGVQHLEVADQEPAFLRALQPFLAAAPPVERATSEEVAVPAQPTRPSLDQGLPPTESEWRDLAQNRPGEQVRAEAEALLADMRDRSRVGTFLARAFDVKTDERAYRVGAKGEEAVGPRLERLVAHGWRVLHSIPVGKGKSDIDHLLIGPGGIYTINTKNHPMKQVWVGEHVIKVGGHNTRYIPVARYEAERAQKLLSAAVGIEVPAKAVLVILTGTVIPQVTIKQMPDDLLVLDRMDVPRVFRKAPQRLSEAQVDQLYECARRSTTWQ